MSAARPTFNLNAITQFDPRLVTEFDCESSSNPGSSGADNAMLNAGQYRDMFNAYHYAQTLLERIAETGIANISVDQFIEWYKGIHQRMAASLAEDNGFKAGEFSKAQVYRWLHGANTSTLLIAAFAMGMPVDQIAREFLQANSKITAKMLADFFALLNKIGADKSIKIPDYALEGISPQNRQALMSGMLPVEKTLVMEKLAVAFHNRKLNAEEINLVGQFVKLCLPPALLEKQFREDVAAFLAKWKSCPKDDVDKAAALAAEFFYKATEVHPFPNCNGRSATCMMNVVLVTLGMRSILMRDSGDKADPSSSYSKAIDELETKGASVLLGEHVKARITKANQQQTYTKIDEAQFSLITKRVEMAELMTHIKALSPNLDLNIELDRIEDEWCKKNKYTMNSKITVSESINGLNYFIQHFTKMLEKLRSIKLMSVSTVTQKSYNEEEKTEISAILKAHTNKKWIVNSKNGFALVTKVDSREAGDEMVALLEATHALKAKVMQPARSSASASAAAVKYFVQIDAFNLKKLRALAVTMAAAKSNASAATSPAPAMR
ncbi:MAG: Fic family protein [Gammaproteobacteria bacterium]|nr:Fic family protein [Gammaproteobacteria bacterium]